MTKRVPHNHSDLTGHTFGKVHVEHHVTGAANTQGIFWHCRCTCSPYAKLDVWSYDLLSGRVRDCGCTKKARKRKQRQRARQKRQAEKTLLVILSVCAFLHVTSLLKKK